MLTTTEIQQQPLCNARLEKNQLIINEDVTLKEWKDLGYYLSNIQGNVQFWIGDWARFGAKKGYYTSCDVYDELEEITGLDRQTIKDYKWVAEKTSSSRKDDLSYNHHKQVAKLDPNDQVYFLTRALQEKLSVAELRLQIIYETTSGNGTVKNDRYENDNPFPIRLGDLHLKLQQEAFEMKTTIHLRVRAILNEYFERKERMLLSA